MSELSQSSGGGREGVGLGRDLSLWSLTRQFPGPVIRLSGPMLDAGLRHRLEAWTAGLPRFHWPAVVRESRRLGRFCRGTGRCRVYTRTTSQCRRPAVGLAGGVGDPRRTEADRTWSGPIVMPIPPAGPVQAVTAEFRAGSTFRSGPCGWTMSEMPGRRFALPALGNGGSSRRYKGPLARRARLVPFRSLDAPRPRLLGRFGHVFRPAGTHGRSPSKGICSHEQDKTIGPLAGGGGIAKKRGRSQKNYEGPGAILSGDRIKRP